MSEFFTTITILLPFGLLLFYHIQSRIGDEQKMQRIRFAKENPHLEFYLRMSPLYQDYYSTRPKTIEIKRMGGMTDEQKKNSLRKCGQDTTLG